LPEERGIPARERLRSDVLLLRCRPCDRRESRMESVKMLLFLKRKSDVMAADRVLEPYIQCMYIYI